jgi:hypothetical protein
MLTRAAALFLTGLKPSLALALSVAQPATSCQTVLPLTPTKQTTDPSPARHQNAPPAVQFHFGKTLSSRAPAFGSRAEGSAVASAPSGAGPPTSNRYTFRSGIAATPFPSSKVLILIDTESGVSSNQKRNSCSSGRPPAFGGRPEDSHREGCRILIDRLPIRNAANPPKISTNPISNRQKTATFRSNISAAPNREEGNPLPLGSIPKRPLLSVHLPFSIPLPIRIRPCNVNQRGRLAHANLSGLGSSGLRTFCVRKHDTIHAYAAGELRRSA